MRCSFSSGARSIAARWTRAPRSSVHDLTIYPGVGDRQGQARHDARAGACRVHRQGLHRRTAGRAARPESRVGTTAAWSRDARAEPRRRGRRSPSAARRRLPVIGPGLDVAAAPHGLPGRRLHGPSNSRLDHLLPEPSTSSRTRAGRRRSTSAPRITPSTREQQNDIGDWRVTEVHVRRPYVRLPEFAPGWPNHCRSDWRTADSPS